MFPHEITIFGKQTQDKTYPRTPIKGVLWYGSETMVIAGKGLQNNDSINIVIPKENIPNNFKIEKGFRIVKGNIPDIESSITELNQYTDCIIVSSINDYDFGSNLDCILIGGK